MQLSLGFRLLPFVYDPFRDSGGERPTGCSWRCVTRCSILACSRRVFREALHLLSVVSGAQPVVRPCFLAVSADASLHSTLPCCQQVPAEAGLAE
jgi:hypothetical protein